MLEESSRPPCAVCKTKTAIYTCPRCSLRTCSLPCSTTHKTNLGCSGERDKTAYVPLRDYGYKDMVNDYVFLEDAGRKVTSWGRDIVQGGLNRGKPSADKKHGPRRAPQRSNRDTLQAELEKLDIDMDLLPEGMHKRTINKSTWDHKKKQAMLTVEYKFHNPPERPFSLVVHRNSPTTTLKSLIETHAQSRKQPVPDWVLDLAQRDERDRCPFYAISNGSQSQYQPLDPSQPLLTTLRGCTFVEFPTIEIWDAGNFTGTIGGRDDGLPDRKRRKLNATEGKRAIQGLLGDYGSDDDQEQSDDEHPVDKPDAIVDYGEESGDEEGGGEQPALSPEELLKLLQQVEGNGGNEPDWNSDQETPI